MSPKTQIFRARKIWVFGDICNPGWLATQPNPPGKPDAAVKRALPGNGFEFPQPSFGQTPQMGAAQNICLFVNQPERTQFPTSRPAKCLQNFGSRFFQSG